MIEVDVIEVSVIEAEVLEVKEMKLELDFVEVPLVRGEKRAAVMTGSPVGAKVAKLGRKRVPKGGGVGGNRGEGGAGVCGGAARRRKARRGSCGSPVGATLAKLGRKGPKVDPFSQIWFASAFLRSAGVKFLACGPPHKVGANNGGAGLSINLF